MNVIRCLMAAGVLGIAGCAGPAVTGPTKSGEIEILDFVGQPPIACEVKVHVVPLGGGVAGDILIDQEPARNRNCTSRTISFKVVGPYRFASTKGIDIYPNSPSAPSCTGLGSNQVDCTFGAATDPVRGDKVPYGINIVTKGSNPIPVGSLDPMMINY